MQKRCLTFAAAVGCTAAAALAHDGSRVWVGNVGGTISTYTSDNDGNPTQFFPAQVFSAALEDLFGSFSTEFPGYEVKTIDGQVASGTTFGFRLAGPLLALNPAGTALGESQEIFGPPAGPGPVPQMALSRNTSFRITNNSVQEGFDFFGFSALGDHAHLTHTLLGDGVSAVDGPNGAYVVPMMLTSASLTRSDWYFIVLTKAATSTQRDQAIALAQIMADALPGDANFSGTVDIGDFSTLAANFNISGRWWKYGDFDFDGDIDIADFSQLAANFNQSSLNRTTVPEPAILGGAALITILGKRTRRNEGTKRNRIQE